MTSGSSHSRPGTRRSKLLANYLDGILRGGVSLKCIFGDGGAGQLERSGKFLKMLAERGISWRPSARRTKQSNEIDDTIIKQIMAAAGNQLIKSGRGEKFWSFTVMDATFEQTAAPHEYLSYETPHER